jgi:hypothetical protein
VRSSALLQCVNPNPSRSGVAMRDLTFANVVRAIEPLLTSDRKPHKVLVKEVTNKVRRVAEL